VIAKPTNEEETALFKAIKKRLDSKPGFTPALPQTSRV